MNVNAISGINFRAEQSPKKKFLTPNIQKGIQKLLREMNMNTVYKENPAHTGWESNILSSLKMGEDKVFTDYRFYIKPVVNPGNFTHDCSLEMGNTKLDINSTTGEILRHKKSWFSTWSSVYKQAEDCIKMFVENFDNPKIVKQRRLGLAGYTQKGFKILQDSLFGLKRM